MKHLDTEQLKKYGERRLNADEMTRAVLHLDECGACFDSFQTMFPALSNRAREVSGGGLTADDAEIFHLDYEEHLRPFVDFEADQATREIVESHIENCRFCARAVRELREFSGDFHLREISKVAAGQPTFFGAADYRRDRAATGNFRRWSLPVIAVLILTIGGWLIWRQSETPVFIAENQTPQNAPPVSVNENSFNRQPENSAVSQPIKLPVSPRETGSANKNIDSVGDKKRQPSRTEDEILLAALPPDFRAQFQNVGRTQKISLPAFITDLRGQSNLRGASDGEKNIILSPNAQAERSARPTFRWRKFAAAESYVVTVYDENYNQIAVSSSLRGTQWQSNVFLKRGRTYQWQVKAAASAESHAARFKVLDGEAIARLKKIEKAAPHSPRARGIGYALEGLLSEAEQEFQRATVKNPGGSLAKKLKQSLLSQNRLR